jgi:hypothetical protein
MLSDIEPFFKENKDYISCQYHNLGGDIEKVSGYREKEFWGGWW